MKLIDCFKTAREGKYSIGAFNVDSLEVLKAIFEAAKNLNSPVLLEVSPGEVNYFGLQNFVCLVNNLREETPVPVFINLDHADDLEIIKEAVEMNFDLIHFDGSKLSLEENIKLTKEVVTEAHARGILVEGEIDHFPGESTLHRGGINTNSLQIYTNPQTAKMFVEETGVDILAAFIGNMHGVYDEGIEKINIEQLQKITAVLPNTFFSLHGGSGIPAEDVRAAIYNGIVKVNVNTELRIAFKDTLENMLKGNPDEYTWSKLAIPPIEAVCKKVEEKIEIFGSKDRI